MIPKWIHRSVGGIQQKMKGVVRQVGFRKREGIEKFRAAIGGIRCCHEAWSIGPLSKTPIGILNEIDMDHACRRFATVHQSLELLAHRNDDISLEIIFDANDNHHSNHGQFAKELFLVEPFPFVGLFLFYIFQAFFPLLMRCHI